MSSNPLYGLRKVGTFVQLIGVPGRPVRQPVFAGCTRRLCKRRLWLVMKSTLEVYVVQDDALYKMTIFTFNLYFYRASHKSYCYLPFNMVECAPPQPQPDKRKMEG